MQYYCLSVGKTLFYRLSSVRRMDSESSKETLTIEQFKDRISATRIDVKKNESTGEPYFEASNVKGKVSTKEIPRHSMISLFITSDSNEHWLLHEEGSVLGAPEIAIF